MEIRYGLISSDSHGQLGKDAYTSRMSKAKWGGRIPQIVEVREEKFDYPVERWSVNGEIQKGNVCNCPTAMKVRGYYPQRWEEVPLEVYDPASRLKALDRDRVDAEVLFPNGPGGTFLYGDPEFELACVRAYNDALAEYREVSDRFIPLAVIPYMSPIETVVAEVEHAVSAGHGGINILGDPSVAVKGQKNLSDPSWDPLWEACQALNVGIHLHASAGLAGKLSLPQWKGYSRRQAHTVSTLRNFCTATQIIPFLIYSGVLERFPRLSWVFAETGLGWVSSVLEACDHEWERRRLWTEGITARPSELFRRQVYVDFWFETVGIELRDFIGLDNILWESDFPHITSTYPNSWSAVERSLAGVAKEEQEKILFRNAARLYRLN
ncbi:MAG TPA: amidohydrolase family protein [Candidatus Eisenbacteria bacterium]|nr:amidohydrolase family protein [Candidatus Eisenbacteria bacterium]